MRLERLGRWRLNRSGRLGIGNGGSLEKEKEDFFSQVSSQSSLANLGHQAGLGDLFHRLKYGSCNAFFQGQGVDALQQFGQNITFGQMDRPTVGGIPTPDRNGMVLNADPWGAFLSPPDSFFGAVGPTQVQSFIIGHELAHDLSGYTGFFDSDSPQLGPTGAARQAVNNLRLSYNCY
jgi:hypothetical protein